MQIKRFAAPLGAVVEGLDVRDVDETTWQTLNDAFCEHHVLVFPDQTLTPEDHMAFGQRWGSLVRHPYAGMSDRTEELR